MSNSTGSFSDSQTGVNMASILGSQFAYMGFTGATGGANATQTISNFTYAPNFSTLPNGTPVVLSAERSVGRGRPKPDDRLAQRGGHVDEFPQRLDSPLDRRRPTTVRKLFPASCKTARGCSP